MIGGDLLRYRKDVKYISCDGESENLNLVTKFNRPWQFAWIVVENGQIVKEFNKFPWIHDLKVSEDAARITRFNYNDYKNKATDAKPICEELISYVYNPDYLVLGQNLWFDLALLRNLEDYVGLDNSKKIEETNMVDRLFDTSAIAKALKLGLKWPAKLEDKTSFQFSLMNFRQKGLKTNLKQLCMDNDIPYDPNAHHDALNDCIYTDKVFRKQIWQAELK